MADLVAICRAFAVAEKAQICGGEVSVPQCVALQTLAEKGPQDNGSLAEELSSSISATTRLVDGLEKRDWVVREKDPEDRRRVLVSLTDEGEQQAEDLLDTCRSALMGVLGRIPTHKQSEVIEAVGVLRDAIEDLVEEL